MSVRPAAVAALVALCAWALPAHAGDRLSLDDALARVARTHPDLQLWQYQRVDLEAQRDIESQRPALQATVEIENAFGTGEASGTGNSEVTFGLASVLERGGKLDARRTLAQQQIDGLAVQRETQRLDLMAETARRYLALLAAHERQAIAATDVAQRQQALAAARRRYQAGASPESVVLGAQAQLVEAQLDAAAALQRTDAARRHLAALWGERTPRFDPVATDLARLPALSDLETLSGWLERTPELERFADAQRLAEARLRLARSQTSSDIEWSLGLRREQASGDVGLVAGLGIALGSRQRAQPGIRAAENALTALEIEREAQAASLYSTLVDAHDRYQAAAWQSRQLRSEVLPLIERAEAAAGNAYRSGAASAVEWHQLQAERIAALRRQLESVLEAHAALIEIQRLTGQAFVAGPSPDSQDASR